MTTPIPTPELPIRCKNCGGEIRDNGTVWVHVKYGVAEGKRAVSEDQDCERLWGRTVTPSLIAEPELTTRFPVPEPQAERIATLERLVVKAQCVMPLGALGALEWNAEAEAALRKEPPRG